MRLEYDLAQIDIHGWVPLSGRITALVTDESRRALGRLPNLQISEFRPIPETVRSGGITYHADELIIGSFSIDKEKDEVYPDCARQSLLDLIEHIKNPEYQLRVSLKDGLRSLQMAKGIVP